MVEPEQPDEEKPVVEPEQPDEEKPMVGPEQPDEENPWWSPSGPTRKNPWWSPNSPIRKNRRSSLTPRTWMRLTRRNRPVPEMTEEPDVQTPEPSEETPDAEETRERSAPRRNTSGNKGADPGGSPRLATRRSRYRIPQPLLRTAIRVTETVPGTMVRGMATTPPTATETAA